MLNNLDTIHHYHAATGEAVEKLKPYKRSSGKLPFCLFAVVFAFPKSGRAKTFWETRFPLDEGETKEKFVPSAVIPLCFAKPQ